MRRNRTIWILFLILLTLLVEAPAVSGADEEVGVRDDNLYVGSYYVIPGTTEWASFDTGIPDDLYEYNFRLKCFDENAGDIECLYGDRNACTAGEGGRRVYWFMRLKDAANDAWMPMDPPLSCIYSTKPRDIGDQIRETILQEFQSRPIVSGILNIQPNPHTLVGAHTNFYVDAEEQVFDFVMFEQDIHIVARPTEYDWTYGDGTVYGPAHVAGGALPRDRWGEETATSHQYQEPGDYQASVVVHFSAEYSINGGPMVPIDGRATVPSAPQVIRVWKSESRNVADDCLVNPAGFGCS